MRLLFCVLCNLLAPTILLGDFGFAAQLTKERQKRDTISGTTYWCAHRGFCLSWRVSCDICRMAPEMIKGLEYDTSVDVWALGVLIMEMSDGHPPYIDLPELQARTRAQYSSLLLIVVTYPLLIGAFSDQLQGLASPKKS